MKGFGGCLLVVLAGCGTSAAVTARDGGAADAVSRDDAVTGAVIAMDAPTDAVVAADALDAAAACAIAASGPRALRLRGQATYARDAGAQGPRTLAEELLLFLPRGRAAGAPFIIGLTEYAGRFIEVPGMFDERGAVDGLRYAGADWTDVSWAASMAAPDGPLALRISRNLNTSGDVRDDWEGAATLCPEGDAPAPSLRPLVDLGPVGPWRFAASAPVASGVASISLRANGSPVEASARWEAGWLTVTPARAVAPGAEVAMDLAGVRDPVGRVFAQAGTMRALATTAVVVDRAFDAAPPAGSVVGGRAETRDGALRLSSPTGRMGPYVALVALGDVPAGPVTVRYRTLYAGEVAAWLVRGDGTSAALAIEPTTAMDPVREASATVAESGPLWLQVVDRSATQRPGWLPRMAGVFALDEVRVGM